MKGAVTSVLLRNAGRALIAERLTVMSTLVNDPWIEQQVRIDRERSGARQFDEVWDGVYFIPPSRDNEHQELVLKLGMPFSLLVDWDWFRKCLPGHQC